jgi:hypothetical protein
LSNGKDNGCDHTSDDKDDDDDDVGGGEQNGESAKTKCFRAICLDLRRDVLLQTTSESNKMAAMRH